MERLIGTVSRGVRAPIIRSGDDIAAIVVDSVPVLFFVIVFVHFFS